MSRNVFRWMVAEGVFVLIFGVIAALTARGAGRLVFGGWLDWTLIVLIVASIGIAAWRPSEPSLGLGLFGLMQAFGSLQAMGGSVSSAPILAVLCAMAMLCVAGIGYRQSHHEWAPGS